MFMHSTQNLFKALFLSLLFCGNLISQDAFQRLYTTSDRDIVNLDVVSATGGGFYLLNASINPASTSGTLDMLMISKHDPKGSLVWSNEYTVDDINVMPEMRVTSINKLDKDTLVVTGAHFDSASGLYGDDRYIIKISPRNGELLTAQTVSSLDDAELNASTPLILNGFDSDYAYFASHSNGDTLGIQHIRFDSNDTILDQRAIYVVNQDQSLGSANLYDGTTTVDSNYIHVFTTDSDSTKAGLVEMTPEGTVAFSSQLSISPDSLTNARLTNLRVTSSPDSSTFMLAQFLYDDMDLAIERRASYLTKYDSLFQLQWVRFIGGGESFNSIYTNDLVYTSMNEIVVTGKYENGILGADFSVIFNDNGDLVRLWDYESDFSYQVLLGGSNYSEGSIDNMKDGGMVYTTTGFDLNEGSFSPIAIKMDMFGQALCQDTLEVEIVRDFALIEESLDLADSNFASVDTFDVTRSIYDGFTIPVLQLLDTFFCPQDPIMVTLDATIENASTYEWATGEITPTLFVDAEGEYSVTVTLEDKICYTLCDTSTITQRDFPEATIDAQFFGECEVDSIFLSVGSNNPIVDLAWSTGDSTNRTITVFDAGLYSVSITDDCGNLAIAEINISDEIISGSPSILDIVPSGRTCDGVILTPIIIGNTDGLTYSWSQGGSTEEVILVNENGSYTLTVENACGNSDSFTVEVDNLLDLSVEIFPEGECSDLSLTAQVGFNSFVGSVEYLWNDGSTSNVLDGLNSAGVYTVTVTDDCGTTAEASYTVADSLAFPDMFFPGPGAENPINQSFGAHITCPEFFEGTNFLIEVFNRFGNKVFEATDISTRWDGTYSGDFVPRDVYMYQWSYDNPDGERILGEGTVTAHR